MSVQSEKIDVEKSKDSAPDSFSKKTPNYIDVMNLLNSKEKKFLETNNVHKSERTDCPQSLM